MQLYVTAYSPYARIARIVVLEKGLEERVEIRTAQTRVPDSPYYGINPSGRVPCLVRGDGVVMEESSVICAYLDHLEGKPVFDPPSGDAAWEARRLEALARSMLDGFAVWAREIRRPASERSPTILRHEAARAARTLDAWERQIEHPLLRGPLDMTQITLASALGFAAMVPDLHWRPGRSELSAWFDRIAARPSIAATAPQSDR